MTEQPAPRRTDPLAAALAFAIREAVRLEAERERLPVAPDSANVVAMKPKRGARGGMTARALPRSLEDLRGRRAARWIRESTAGQADNFGPDAQLEQQSRAIERWGLVDTGGAWQVAHSGRTIAATGQWAEMLAGAGEDWEVLVVGYVSRFARDLRTAVNARHDLHARGAVILFADERVLSSDEDEWERWAREAVEAEAYSRRLAKRIREGYAAKRRRLGVPGGNKAPLGTVRDGRTITVDEVDMAVVRRVYELAAGGRTDREVGAVTGLALKHVAEILTNPFYIGRLLVGRAVSPRLSHRPRHLGARPGAPGPVQPPPPRVGQPPSVRAGRPPGLRGLRPPPHRARRPLPAPGRLRGLPGRSAAPRPARRGDDRPAGAGRVLQGRRVRAGDRARLRARRGVSAAQGRHGGAGQATGG